MMDICNKDNCTGCYSCMSTCPRDAISEYTDEYGKTVPMIDESKCISCGLCEKNCPVNYVPEFHTPLHAIAAWSKQEKDVVKSASGGVASVFARKVLQEGGVVYGAAFVDGNVKHTRVTEEPGIERLRGSKYVQSYTGTIFRDVKRDLIEGKRVLFTGVPCQIAGLKAYLKIDYENLITVDLICHGTPPMKYLKEYIDGVVKKTWDSVSFRGERDYYLTVYKQKDILYLKSASHDLYFKSFSDGMSYRNNCYRCTYAQPNRCADITIGDFWGIERSTLKNPYKGRISLVLLNDPKGIGVWEQCKDFFVWEERTLEEAMNPTQGNLLRPSKPHDERTSFLKNYPKHGFTKSVAATQLGKETRRRYFQYVLQNSFVYRTFRKVKHLGGVIRRRLFQ